MHSDRGDFRAPRPHAREPLDAARIDAEIAQCIDDRLLNGTDIEMHIALPVVQIQNRVADHLPGTMIRHIPAPVGFVKCDARAVQRVFAREQVFTMRVSAESDGVRMLDKQQTIRYQARFARAREALLQLGRGSPIHPAQILDFQNLRHLWRGRRHC
jgi:hypothetical protein